LTIGIKGISNTRGVSYGYSGNIKLYYVSTFCTQGVGCQQIMSIKI